MTQNLKWSVNCQAYFDYWMNLTHSNHCKHECQCYEGAYKLTVDRINCINRGMPDLEAKLDSQLWIRAFELHDLRCVGLKNIRAGVITPTWSEKAEPGSICDCFEEAYNEYKIPNYKCEIPLKPEPVKEIVFVYDPSYDDRIV